MPLSRMSRTGVLFLFFVAWMLTAVGCADKAEGNHKDAKPEVAVLATIGDEVITTADLEAAMRNIPQRKGAQLRDRVLDNLIEGRVFALEATRAGLDQDPEVREIIEKETRETLAFYFVKKRIDPEATPSEEVLREFYESHEDQFVVPVGVHLQEIVVNDESKAGELLQQLKEGASFEILASENSVVRSVKKGGDAGWIYKGRMDPNLEKVVFNLKKNELSDVIKTKKGRYQIVRVLDTADERLFSFEEAKPKIAPRLFWERKRELIEQYYQAAGVDKNPGEPGVLVKIGDKKIPEEAIAAKVAKAPEKDREKMRSRWIDYFVETNVFSAEARKIQLEKDPEVAVDIRRKTDHAQANAFRNKFLSGKTLVTDGDIAEYYGSYPEQFTNPAKVLVQSVLVKTKEEAEAVLLEAKAGNAFGLLAQKKSLRPDAVDRAGDIGWFARGEKDPALEAVAFSLEKGQISDVIKTADGYEVIKLTDKKGGDLKPLEEVQTSIRMTLTMQKFEKEKKRYYEKAEVKVVGS